MPLFYKSCNRVNNAAILGLSCANPDSRFVRAILGLPAQFRIEHAQTLDWLKPWIGSIPGLSKHIIAAQSWNPMINLLFNFMMGKHLVSQSII